MCAWKIRSNPLGGSHLPTHDQSQSRNRQVYDEMSADKSRSLGISALSHSIVGGLFKESGNISGAWAFDYREPKLYVIRSNAVILTTGGIGAMYPVGDNVSTATGEGFALAFNAGAELTGVEFSLFFADRYLT